jgi:hypothetical protein
VEGRRGFCCRSGSHFAVIALYVRAMLRTLPTGFISQEPASPIRAMADGTLGIMCRLSGCGMAWPLTRGRCERSAYRCHAG